MDICKAGRIKFFLLCLALLVCAVACDSEGPPKSDKELFIDFYRNVMHHASLIDQKYGPFNRALARQNIIEAISVASSLEADVKRGWMDLENIKTPALADRSVQKSLADAKDLMGTSYYNKHKLLLSFIEYSKKPSLYLLAEVKDLMEKSRLQLIVSIDEMISSGEKLGVDPLELSRSARPSK